jgi:hypothetical protein
MNRTDRFKKVMEILEINNLCNNTVNHCMFDKLEPNELDNSTIVNEIIVKIKAYEDRLENNPNNYPENIMQYLRQRDGLDKYDTSNDQEFNKMSKSQVFKEVLNWNGLLGGYDTTMKRWIFDIYSVDLDKIGE